MQVQMDIDGQLDRYKKIQLLCSNVDDSLMGPAIEQLWIYPEEDCQFFPQ